LVENAAERGEQALAGLRELQSRRPLIGDVRGRGCMLAAELVLDRDTREPAFDAADAVLYAALRRGLNFKVMSGNVLVWTPPLVITDEHVQLALSILDESLTEVEQAL
jgi:4-aminobutyrate aminotransferase